MSRKPVVLMILDGYGLNERHDGNACGLYAFAVRNRNQFKFWFSPAFLGFFEHIIKAVPDIMQAFRVGKNGKGLFPRKNPQIVHPVDMVGVGVRDQYRIQSPDVCPQGLQTEFRPGIQQNRRSVLRAAEQGTGAHPFVLGRDGCTYAASTCRYRNARACA